MVELRKEVSGSKQQLDDNIDDMITLRHKHMVKLVVAYEDILNSHVLLKLYVQNILYTL